MAGQKTSAPIREIFKGAFQRAGLPYFYPHLVRKTVVLFAMEASRGDTETLKAISQNLGHEDVLTTLRSYGAIPANRQRDLIRGMATAPSDERIALELGRQALATMRANKAV